MKNENDDKNESNYTFSQIKSGFFHRRHRSVNRNSGMPSYTFNERTINKSPLNIARI